jgi:hypothetical protein
MNKNIINITGEKYGRLTVLNYIGTKNGTAVWRCRCDCGNEVNAKSNALKNGKTKSCGCMHREIAARTAKKTHTKHGMIKTRLYHIWTNIKQRCRNKKQYAYKWYGERGIDICDEWFNSFEAFRDWALNSGYRDDLTIDRIDNNGNYEPLNCRWATLKQQAENKSNNIFIELDGIKMTQTEWSRKLGKNINLISCRLSKGWDKQEAASTPPTVHYHGMTNTRLHRIWSAMKTRCYNKKVIGYNSNGAMGIKVCKEWNDNFENFYKWAKESDYQENLVISRIDKTADYGPDNCQWIDRATQSRKRPYVTHIEYNGESLTMAEWSKRLGGNSNLVRERIKNGYEPIRAITEPIRINQFQYKVK